MLNSIVGRGGGGGQAGRGPSLLLLLIPAQSYTDLKNGLGIGLGTEFRSEKIPRNRLGTVSVIPRKKVLIPRHSEFRGRANSETRNGTKWNRIPLKYEVLRNLHSFSDHSDGLYILLWVVFSSAECFGTEFREFASIFVPRNGIPSSFLFRWSFLKGIPRVCFYFCSTEQNSKWKKEEGRREKGKEEGKGRKEEGRGGRRR